MRHIAIILCAICFAACATRHQPLTRAEWLDISKECYSGVPKEVLISAAEKILILADGEDMTFTHYEDGFTATRMWAEYYIIAFAMGTDVWRFQVKEQPDGSMCAHIQVSISAGSVLPHPTTGGNVGLATTPTTGHSVQGTAIYNLFWHRLDNLLGLNNYWVCCKVASRLMDNDSVDWWGNISPLCNPLNTRNTRPKYQDKKPYRVKGASKVNNNPNLSKAGG